MSKPLPKTVVRKYLSSMLLEYGSGFTYEFDVIHTPNDATKSTRKAYYKLSAVENVYQNDTVVVDILTKRGWYCITTKRFVIPSREDIDAALEKSTGMIKSFKRPRDFQRQRVYNWEYRNISSHPKKRLTELDIKALIADVCDVYDVKPPRLELSNQKKRTSSYYPGLHLISLARGWGQEISVILHELAHALTRYEQPAHGGKFMSVLLELYAMYLGYNYDDLRQTAVACNLVIE